ncbi:hypothetical protein CcCBS67573_g10104 [Chytriomyces confervae]|uniref:PPIase cyclophilin-type domain-containing protein n=1 Tax=Chytriomyces confervae TaxID=246404 RepID=A0A507DH50_9FUNG|nr:hypothetical protein CcCBS67573_g10104 [Chytriomyces confervae]
MAQPLITFAFTAQDAIHHSQLEKAANSLKTSSDQIEVLSSIHAATSSTPLSFTSPGVHPPSTLVLNLFSNVARKPSQTAYGCAMGRKRFQKQVKKPLHYLGNRVHRIVEAYCKRGWQVHINGSKNLTEKALKLPISRGSLLMANIGKHSNTSQVFLVLLNDAERIRKNMQGKHVVLGHVYGMGVGDDLLDPVAKESVGVFKRLDTINDGTELLIKHCGVLRE